MNHPIEQQDHMSQAFKVWVAVGAAACILILIFIVWMSNPSVDCDDWNERFENALIDDAMYHNQKTQAAVDSVQANYPKECK